MATFPPTAEQAHVLDLFRAGHQTIAVQAGAGTGKTTTLRMMAEQTDQRGQYVAFNRSIVQEAAATMPGNVTASTAHSLAFRSVGRRFKHRLDSPRMRSAQLARELGVDPLVIKVGQVRKVLSAEMLAGTVMRGVSLFCQSADPITSAGRHVPFLHGIDGIDPETHRPIYGDNNRAVAHHLEDHLEAAWRDLSDPDGRLPYRHEHYLKLWQLGDPLIPARFILFDEAQDASPVMLDVVRRQDHAQLILVGDSQQSIYGFTGAVNAMADVDERTTGYLTQSWRFGPAIAEVANEVLAMIPDALLRLEGNPNVASVVGPVAEPDVILSRTNAAALSGLMHGLGRGAATHIIGGGEEIVRFARAADKLQQGGRTEYPDLACFDTWPEVVEYVAEDPLGGELSLMVRLIEEFGCARIIAAIAAQVPEAQAELILSTAHKSKGREWQSVRLAGDFPDDDRTGEPDELRLTYVACTRAMVELDNTDHPLWCESEQV